MRFIYLVSVVGALLLAIVSGTYAYVSQYPRSPDRLAVNGLDVCDDKPCFLEITPGRTPWVNLPRMLRRFNIQGNQLTFYISVSQSVRAEISYHAETYVHQIIITNYASSQRGNFPAAGDFVQLYGLPCLVEIGNPSVRLIYPLMTVTMKADHLTPYTSVVSVVQTGNYAAGDPCAAGRNAEHTLQWSGFASVNRYRAMLTRP
jgi:hypothetical protein